MPCLISLECVRGGGPVAPDAMLMKSLKGWASQEELYAYDNPGFSASTAKFTQLVWRGEKRVGFACVQSLLHAMPGAIGTCVVLQVGTVWGLGLGGRAALGWW